MRKVLSASWWGNSRHRKFSLIIFVILASLDNVAIGIVPPLYEIMSRNFHTSEASIGLVTALCIFIRGITAIVWGYLGDRINRKRLLILGTIVWILATWFTGTAKTLLDFLAFQSLASIGFGCIEPLGFSIVNDFVSPLKRGLAMSLWGLSQSWGMGLGLLLAGYTGYYNWSMPFHIVTGAGFVFLLLYIFAFSPERGYKKLQITDISLLVSYKINVSNLPKLFVKITNIWLILSYFVMRFIQGAYIWIPTLFLAKVEMEGYGIGIATLVGSLFAGIFSLGNYFSIVAGYIGDLWHKRDLRGRLKISALGTIGSIPLYVGLFILPLKGLNLPNQASFAMITYSVIDSIFHNAWVASALICSIVAVALSSIPIPNWSASVCDVNLPENRSTVFGFSSFCGGIGGAMGNGIMGVVITFFTAKFPSPNNYILGFLLLSMCYFPLGFLFYMASRSIVHDFVAS